MPDTMPWTLLNILVWSLGLQSARELRSQFDPRAKTWFLLEWGVRFCLVMEVAMLGMGLARGLALLSAASGIASAALMWLGFRSLQEDVCEGKSPPLGGGDWDRVLRWSLSAGVLLCVAGGWTFPRGVEALIRALHPAEGAAWLAASAWLGLRLSTDSCPAPEARVFRPSRFSLSFGLAFLNSALAPLSRLTGFPVLPEAGPLLSALFVLTMVWELGSLVVRVQGFKALEAQGELQALNEKLFGIEKLAAVGTLAAGAAHDFNNVLSAILGASELALKEPGLPEQTRQDLQQIRSSARAAAGLSAQLMGVARQGAGGGNADLKEAVERPLAVLAKEFARRKIQVVARLEGAPPVSGDLGQIRQVVLNLLLNARDAMIPKGGGVLEVSLAAKGDEVEIAVSDTGTGIPREFQPRVFQPLQSTKGDKGTGLGLSASRSVIASMGGSITYETQEGSGTTFRVRLPAEKPHPGVPRGPASRPVVLIVDDEEAARKTLKRMVEALGHAAVAAESAEEAFRMLSADPGIRLVISDVHMPGTDGTTLLKRVLSEFNGVRVLLVTGAAAVTLPAGPRVLGLLRKPVEMEDLRKHLA